MLKLSIKTSRQVSRHLACSPRSASTAAPSSQYSGYETIGVRQPSKYGWRYHLDNTFQFILWASFGSAAIHLLNVKQKYAEKDRRLSTKIAVLKDIIRRVREGEEVDVARELKVGKTEEERDWEEVINSFREEANNDTGVQRANADPGSIGAKVQPDTQAKVAPVSIRNETSSIVPHAPSPTTGRNSGWFWSG